MVLRYSVILEQNGVKNLGLLTDKLANEERLSSNNKQKVEIATQSHYSIQNNLFIIIRKLLSFQKLIFENNSQ